MVRFVDNASVAAALQVQGEQRSGLLWTPRPVNVSWEQVLVGDTLMVKATVHLDSHVGFFSAEGVECNLTISRSLSTSLEVNNSFGGIDVVTTSGVNLTNLDVRTSLGAAKLVVANDTVLSGMISMETSLGGLDLVWKDVVTAGDTNVTLRTSAGSVDAVLVQHRTLGGNLSMAISSSLGSVTFSLDIDGNTSARIRSDVGLGEVKVQEQSGFVGNATEMWSTNYLQVSNFDVTCTASAGSVELRAKHSE
jgi:hypothetical protein